ncbi:hypothetical protein SEF58_06535 [Neomoorella humiferrea]|uniref:hypothetical protein n=1 Tax=Neomoorella humiferrea TaxID=676965 RepID=UPI003D91CDB4
MADIAATQGYRGPPNVNEELRPFLGNQGIVIKNCRPVSGSRLGGVALSQAAGIRERL